METLRRPVAGGMTALGLILLAGTAAAEDAVSTYVQLVHTHASQGPVEEVEGAKARLTTTPEAAFVNISTSGLEPNHVYTLWMIAIDRPEACEIAPCTPKDVLGRTGEVDADVVYGDGTIAGPDGRATFNGTLEKGPIPGSWYGNGFDNPQGAEMHFVLNAHGPLLPAIGASMLGSYRGGCRDEGLPEAFPEVAKADGIPGPNTCAMVQDVLFQQ